MTSIFSGCDFAAGWLSGISGLVVGHPFDTMKVWKQTVTEKTSTKEVVVHIYKSSGVKGYFRGMLFPMLSAGALNSLFFGIYGNSMRFLQDYRQVDQALSWSGSIPYPYWHLDVFLAGCAGGLMGVLISCPVELVKTQLQTQTSKSSLITTRVHQYSGPWECLVDQYRHQGVRSLYRGLVPMFWRDIGSSGIYMSTYAHSRERLESQHTVSIMLAGALAGVLSWSTVVPLDVIKSRLQADSKTKPKYKGMIDCAIKSYQHDGFGVFVRGFWLISLRAVPVNAITFVTYEFFISFCGT